MGRLARDGDRLDEEKDELEAPFHTDESSKPRWRFCFIKSSYTREIAFGLLCARSMVVKHLQCSSTSRMALLEEWR